MLTIATRLPWSWIWALSIVLVWLLVAHALGQRWPTRAFG